ncbi:hypothetical protein BH09BAC6_BH09BAC6_35020 [soil metagenome]
MEDLKAYIETGILELYVLGDVSPAEKLQVEEMASKHPAVRAELDEIERSMEFYAAENAVEPQDALRSRVLNSIVTAYNDDSTFMKPLNTEADVISLPAARNYSFYKYAFAACLALLLASGIVIANMYSRLQQSNSQLAALQVDKQHFASRVNLLDHQLGVFRDPSFKFLKLQATPKAPPAASITIAWSPVKHKVMIDMGTIEMPVNDKAHQYQLWALVAGKPVDLGVFDGKSDTTDMKEMRSIASADAFAVTLEPRGGSASPTMDQMMVIGKF